MKGLACLACLACLGVARYAPFRFRVGRLACPKLVLSGGLERNVRVITGNAWSFCYICCGACHGTGTAGNRTPVDTGRGVNYSSLCRE